MEMETKNNNYRYYYMTTNKHNLYLKRMKRMILNFYAKYKNITITYIKNLKINYRGPISVDNFYVSPFVYFDIYV